MRAAFFTTILIFTATAILAQTSALSEDDQNAIRELLASQQENWNSGDIDAFMEGYWKSEKLAFVGSGGVIYGWKPTLDGYHMRYPDKTAMGILTFDILELTGLGNSHARLLGTFHLKRTIGDLSGTFTLLLYKFPDGWKIISDHTSSN